MLTQLPVSLAAILMALVSIAGVWDLRTRKIPNALSLAGVIAGIGLNSFLYGWAGLKQSASGMLLAFFVYFLLWMIRAVGAGDTKLMAAVGSFVGPANWIAIFLIAAILGAAIGIVIAARRGRLRKTFGNVLFILKEMSQFRAPYLAREEVSVKSEKALKLPHGVSVALGCLVFIVWPIVASRT